MIKRQVVRIEDRGKNVLLHLRCGHTKARGKRQNHHDSPPRFAYCAECTDAHDLLVRNRPDV